MAGAALGFSILWTALITTPLMMAMQAISARIGLISGRGISSVIKQAYGRRRLLYPTALLVLVANTINIGADIGAIAQALNNVTSSADAAAALRPVAGTLATLLFSIGINGAGTLAVPILAGSASYAISESFGWSVGIDRPWFRAKAFYGVIVAACVIGMLINFVSVNPISTLFYTAVINGLIAPPLMVVIMIVSNNDRIMGRHVNSRIVNVGGWAATILMTIAAVVTLWSL